MNKHACYFKYISTVSVTISFCLFHKSIKYDGLLGTTYNMNKKCDYGYYVHNPQHLFNLIYCPFQNVFTDCLRVVSLG